VAFPGQLDAPPSQTFRGSPIQAVRVGLSHRPIGVALQAQTLESPSPNVRPNLRGDEHLENDFWGFTFHLEIHKIESHIFLDCGVAAKVLVEVFSL